MIYLLLSIISATAIYVCFKSFKTYAIATFPAIVINYFTAAILGFCIYFKSFEFAGMWRHDWFIAALITGVIFISLFNLVAYTTRTSGISITAIASKMSLVLPVAFFVMADPNETWHLAKALAIALAVAGVVLSSLKQRNNDTAADGNKPVKPLHALFLPLVLFAGSGLLDIVLAYSEKYLFESADVITTFVPTAFATAGVAGVIWMALSKHRYRNKFSLSTVVGGAILGVANFCSIFFLLKAYRAGFLEYSEVIPLNNVGIVGVSTLCGWLIFKEALSIRNIIGLLFCAGAIGLLLFF